MIKTEYLFTIDSKNNIATNKTSFKNLLMSNPQIKIRGDKIMYDNETFSYKLQQNNITNTTFICYHITIEYLVDDFELEDTPIIKYQNLLKDIRSILIKNQAEIETLWDDISLYCSKKAYPLIYQIENLMRKLLTKFMLINVGTKWEKENIPSKISKPKNNERKKDEHGLLYQLDFIDLSTFLFESYSLNNNMTDLKKNIESNENISSELLKDYIPQSNWERYFSNIVSVENEHLKKQWDNLYILRCKIAHNNKFTPNDYENVKSIVNHLRPYLEKALSELDSIKIDANEKEIVSESFARTNNEQLGAFIIEYNTLDNIIRNIYMSNFPESRISQGRSLLFSRNLLHALLDKGLINHSVYRDLIRITGVRNNIVHQTTYISDEEISSYLDQIKYYISYFNNSNNLTRKE